jgi:TonB-linked SusC/RagA family outer membrane protein
MRKLTILLGVLVFHCTAIFAQVREIKGKVIDAKDLSPLTGVTITAKGSKSAALSTANGSFSIKVNARATSLHLSYIGYEDKDIPIDGSSEPITIRLQTSQRALSEVIVVGYGKAARKDITGSITKLNAKDVENFPAPSFESAIQGKAPGVVVLSGSGKVGQAIQINIRGLSSISAGTQPLYVIDGLPVTTASLSDMTNDPTNPLADINPNDIESLEVLKDASAAAIYGARAANGVVLITTKKGKNAQKTAFELNTSTGISNPARQRKYLNAQQYVELINQAVQSDANYDFNNLHSFSTLDSTISYYQSNYYPVMDQLSLGTDWQHAAVNTDWQKLSLHKNAPNNQVNISATGGNDKTRFFISGFYNTQQAIVINNRFSRYGTRFNIDHNASDKLVFGLNMAVDRSQLDKVTFDNSLSSPGELVAQVPISPVIDPNTGQLNNNTLYQNGLYDAQYDHDKQVTYRMLGNAYANYTIIPSLSFRSEIGADLLNLTENEFQGKESQDGAGVGKAQTILSQSVSLNTNNYFTFTPHIDDNNKLATVLGMSYLQNDLLQSNANAQNFPSDAIKNLSGATNVTGAASTNYRYTFLSYFLRANYSLMDRYLLSASIRTDGSSRFSPAHRYGWFPAASAGWVISEEDFLKHSTAVSMLKLRASYGLTGNSEIGESQFQLSQYARLYPPPARQPQPQMGEKPTDRYRHRLRFPEEQDQRRDRLL